MFLPCETTWYMHARMDHYIPDGYFIEAEPEAEAPLPLSIRGLIVLLAIIFFPLVIVILFWERVRA